MTNHLIVDARFVEGRGFFGVIHKGLFQEHVGPVLAESPDGLVWSERRIGGVPTEATVRSLSKTGEWWVAVLSYRSSELSPVAASLIARSRDLENWTIIYLSDWGGDGEGLAFNSVAISGDQLVMFGDRWIDNSPRPRSPSAIVVAGPLTGTLKIKKAPLYHMGTLLETPTGFLALGHGTRDRHRTRIFSSPDGLVWKEISELLGGWYAAALLGEKIVAAGPDVAISTDWGITWTAVELARDFTDPLIKMHIGPVGIALEISEPSAPSSLWFSREGNHFAEVDVKLSFSADSAVFVVAVGDDELLITKRIYTNPPTAEWFRVPIRLDT